MASGAIYDFFDELEHYILARAEDDNYKSGRITLGADDTCRSHHVNRREDWLAGKLRVMFGARVLEYS